MSAPLPLNRKQRREAGDRGKQNHENAALLVKFVRRVERQMEDGSVVAQSFFAPVTASGHYLQEDDTPDGPVPVLFASLPVVVKSAPLIVTRSPRLVTP